MLGERRLLFFEVNQRQSVLFVVLVAVIQFYKNHID